MQSRVTAAMLRDWKERGVTIMDAAAQSGIGRNTIVDQERRHGIRLPRKTAARGSTGIICHRKLAEIRAAIDTTVKAWSASEVAIKRALERAK